MAVVSAIVISAIFDIQVALILLTSFESIDHSIQEKKFKTDFPDGGHGFPTGKVLAIFYLYDANLFYFWSTKFRVNWPFGPGEEV